MTGCVDIIEEFLSENSMAFDFSFELVNRSGDFASLPFDC